MGVASLFRCPGTEVVTHCASLTSGEAAPVTSSGLLYILPCTRIMVETRVVTLLFLPDCVTSRVPGACHLSFALAAPAPPMSLY